MSTMLAITPGEPAGIGPELLVRAAQSDRQAAWVAVADADLLRHTADRLGYPLSIDEALHAPARDSARLTVAHVPLAAPVTPGTLAVANAPYVVVTLERAVAGCLGGEFRGLVTGPVQKSIINDAGVAFTGHTEFLLERAAVDDVVMLLVAGRLRVALATTHLPLAAVPGALSSVLLRRRLGILLAALKADFGIPRPRVLVAGLNPHAGEGGHLGREEIEIIEPVCGEARAAGEDVRGPLPADTIFTPALLETADAVLAMYHDQGLPVLKHHGFGRAVNVTLGLPFVRTSVDHGTALDLAARGGADIGSFEEALKLAELLAG